MNKNKSFNLISLTSIFFIFSLLLFSTYVYLFEQGITYTGDDGTVLQYAIGFNFMEHLQMRIRPIELFTSFLSVTYFDKFWFLISILMTILTVFISSKIIALIMKKDKVSSYFAIVLLASPLYAQLIFQIDTVSQVSGNLFIILSLFYALKFNLDGNQKNFNFLLIFSLFTYLAKESFILFPLFPLVVYWIKIKKFNFHLFTYSTIIFISYIVWIVIKLNGHGIGSNLAGESVQDQYSFHFSLFYIIQNIVVTLSFPINIIPTSFMAIDKITAYTYITFGIVLFLIYIYTLIKFYKNNLRISIIFFTYIFLLIPPLILVKSSEVTSTALTQVSIIIVIVMYLNRYKFFVIFYAFTLFLSSIFNTYYLTSLRCYPGGKVLNNQFCKRYATEYHPKRPYSLYFELTSEKGIYTNAKSLASYLNENNITVK